MNKNKFTYPPSLVLYNEGSMSNKLNTCKDNNSKKLILLLSEHKAELSTSFVTH